ncbi:unnamed protein product [Aspergillus oryzae var. brunneus]|uniref:Unnamed protein product n=2 Tax=Aspergillus oryzae TaxID=5062 RepID=A0AAN4Y5T1_ASPOZ|nr:unnamed protein product [Aspergillus oryzae]GMG22953.1 unnamed protein product [Aspergillus oryzae]GMG43132.1 unnamed protein product [Aspergillus oryzae var. brunneus]
MAENKFVEVDRESFPYIFMKNVDIPLKTHEKGLLRCNVYLPKDSAPYGTQKYPVIATYGPYGKDVPYEVFFKKSWDQVNPDMKSTHASWETPDPGFWTRQGYIVVRTDERGSGQSPGELDTMSRGTSEAFFDVVEWCSEQEWSSGKVGLLGISYFAGTQWRVAARQPKGLAAIIPWEGMSDYYRDRVRHGGILSDRFIDFWWKNAVQPNQYGKPGRASRQWGDDTLEEDLDEQTLFSNRRDQTKDTAAHRFMDEDYYNTRNLDLSSIEVPLLSVANWTSSSLEITGHILARLTVSCSRESPNSSPPTDIDIFVTLRKLNADGKEVFYTGTMGDPVPIVKGWLRVSLRKINTEHPFHRHYLPYRDYTSADVQPVKENERYQVDVEVWPTNTVLDPNETLVLEIAGHDTQGVGKYSHEHPDDRDRAVFGGLNHIEVGQESGYLLLPIIPSREALN